MADPLCKNPREHPCIWSVIVFVEAMLFNLPLLTNMSDTEYSVQERVETMYTVEVSATIGGNERLHGVADKENIHIGRKGQVDSMFGLGIVDGMHILM